MSHPLGDKGTNTIFLPLTSLQFTQIIDFLNHNDIFQQTSSVKL